MTQLYDGDYLASCIQKVGSDLFDQLKSMSSKEVVFVGIVTNGVFFAKRIQKQLSNHGFIINTPVMELDVSLYRDDLLNRKGATFLSVQSSNVKVSLDDKHVVLFDDVLSTSRTARAALNAIFDFGRPKEVSFVVLFDRKNRQLPIEPNIVGADVDVDINLRVNVEFFEVFGEDRVMLGSM